MDKRSVEKGLQKKGFVKDGGDHHYFVYFSMEGKKTPVKTKTSHGSSKYKTLGAPLIAQMARQCKLTKQEFTDLIECPLSQKKYEEQLLDQEII
ncbi:hypothetical protein SAMN02745216_05029 [Desulfatibacillum alkenivorans DSM 16219]|jgi:predicted transcriptional regulator|uniref:HicA toxin of toxin-antitoxin n=1 Tax=Desulfatibacillum alkenivorans DSM 16219 TaxID=1121393 RepID=A0A1M6ZSQ4_9BACT|nr:hypothetical protein [Desulfatibacillum alkenivorans]SHL33518.1 hypothetical protein SAMN02745216_05029 [Desulfatibacillum alkenivorans DSM 16219]